jgi:hypothetical protein
MLSSTNQSLSSNGEISHGRASKGFNDRSRAGEKNRIPARITCSHVAQTCHALSHGLSAVARAEEVLSRLFPLPQFALAKPLQQLDSSMTVLERA